MSEGENVEPRFEDLLSRKEAAADLTRREHVATLRHHIDQAPPLCDLTKLWAKPGETPIGVWGSLQELEPFVEHEQISFFVSPLLDQGQDLSDLRKVKLKVTKPFVISVNEPDEYRLYQLRALGGDAVLLSISQFNVVELQYFIEMGRDLGLPTLLWCREAEDFEKVSKTDGHYVVYPAKLQVTAHKWLSTHSLLPIVALDSLAEIQCLEKNESTMGIMFRAGLVASSPLPSS